MGKLGTAFTPITNPAGTRLLTLIDEATGLRYKINITDFFGLVDSSAQFSGALNAEVADGAVTTLNRTGTAGVTMVFQLDALTIGRIDSLPNGLGIRANTGQVMRLQTNGAVDALILGTDQSATFAGQIVGVAGQTILADALLNDQTVTISGGASTSNGANISMFGGSHANPNKFRIRQGATEVFSITTGGVTTISDLAGTGTRNVVVDANGVLSAP